MLEENTGKTFLDINHSSIFLDQFPKEKERKAKINKWDLNKLTSFLHIKGKHQEKEKTTYRMGENICK